MTDAIGIRRAGVEDIAALAPLFDAYRVFYGKPSDLAVARAFLTERLQREESVIFLAEDGDRTALGFTQLYPGFSSVSVARTLTLNDLFVQPAARRRGVAKQLLAAAAAHGRAIGAVRLSLSTAISNASAQALYGAEGWVRDTQFLTYSLALDV